VTLARRSDRLPPSDRMIAFTDAAVAIALTLLVLPLVEIVPEAARSGEPAVAVITNNLAPIGSFLLSFAVIARFWSAHHRLFGYDHRLTRALIQLNLLWVLTIVVLPFPTEMIATFPSRSFVAPFYLSVLLVASVSLTTMSVLMRRTAVQDGEDDGVPEEFVVGSSASSTMTAAALLLVLVVPGLGPWAFLVMLGDALVKPLIRRLRGDPSRRAQRRTGAA
jgi:uncharacterized membrane protein